MFQALLGRRTGAQRRAGRGRGDAGWGEWVGGTLPDSVCPMTVARMLLGASDGVDPQLPPDVTAIVEHTAIVKAMLVDCENHRLELFGSLRAAERGWLQRNSAVTSDERACCDRQEFGGFARISGALFCGLPSASQSAYRTRSR